MYSLAREILLILWPGKYLPFVFLSKFLTGDYGVMDLVNV
jgi:hypothetical protein